MSGTLGDARPEIEAMERITGNKVRVWDVPDGPIILDYTTPRPRGLRSLAGGAGEGSGASPTGRNHDEVSRREEERMSA
jgi:hypothetical protein